MDAGSNHYGSSKNSHWSELVVTMVNVWNGDFQEKIMDENNVVPVYFFNFIQFRSPIYYVLASLASFLVLWMCCALTWLRVFPLAGFSARSSPSLGLAGSFLFFIHIQDHLLEEAFLTTPAKVFCVSSDRLGYGHR